MKARLLRIGNQLSESYWFVPTIMSVGALLLAALMVWADSRGLATWMDRLPWQYAARPSGARSLLSSIAGSMIGVAGTTFSVTIAAVVYASGQYGPRLLSNFMSDRGNQVTLGTFIATFLYALFVVRTIRSPGETAGAPGFVPQLALMVGILLVLCSIAVLIYFIHHVPSRIHINKVIERIGDRLLTEIDQRFPKPLGDGVDDAEAPLSVPAAFHPDTATSNAHRRGMVRARDTGYIQLIDADSLLACAAKHDLIVRLQYRPGDFVHRGSALLEAYPVSRLDDAAASAFCDSFSTGARRTAMQDMRFLIDELVEIAARALSPGVNDPFTAKSCLDWLGAALAALAGRELPSVLRKDADGEVRAIVHPITFAGFVDQSFGALAQYAASDMIAARHLLTSIEDFALSCDSPGRRATLERMVIGFRALACGSLDGMNRDSVTDHADALLGALAAADCHDRLYARRARGE